MRPEEQAQTQLFVFVLMIRRPPRSTLSPTRRSSDLPDPPGTDTNPVPRRWVEWYAAAVWRATGCPGGKITPENVPALAEAIARHEVDPQVAYHKASSRQVMLLDHRLERISTGAFWTTLIASAGTIAALA